MSLEHDERFILKLLLVLERDEEFFTMGWDNTALLIPFEGQQFNLIVEGATTFPENKIFEVIDATDVLMDYEDAYEGFGINDVFPKMFPSKLGLP